MYIARFLCLSVALSLVLILALPVLLLAGLFFTIGHSFPIPHFTDHRRN